MRIYRREQDGLWQSQGELVHSDPDTQSYTRQQDKTGLWSDWSDAVLLETVLTDPRDLDNNGVNDNQQVNDYSDTNGINDSEEAIKALRGARAGCGAETRSSAPGSGRREWWRRWRQLGLVRPADTGWAAHLSPRPKK